MHKNYDMKHLAGILTVVVLISLMFKVYADGNDKRKNNNSVKVSGQVIDKNSGETLAGAQVRINDINYIITTDLDGNFSIPGLEPGVYTVEITYISYKTEVLKITIPENKEIISLKVKLESR